MPAAAEQPEQAPGADPGCRPAARRRPALLSRRRCRPPPSPPGAAVEQLSIAGPGEEESRFPLAGPPPAAAPGGPASAGSSGRGTLFGEGGPGRAAPAGRSSSARLVEESSSPMARPRLPAPSASPAVNAAEGGGAHAPGPRLQLGEEERAGPSASRRLRRCARPDGRGGFAISSRREAGERSAARRPGAKPAGPPPPANSGEAPVSRVEEVEPPYPFALGPPGRAPRAR